jgi:IS605 OrfB family transposase
MRKRGYKTELDLTNGQVTACLKHAGCARKAYNWGLVRKQEARTKGEPMPDGRVLHRELNALKATEFPYMYEVSKCAPQEALIDLDNAFKHFFRKVNLKKQGKWRGKCGYPKFKSRKKGIGGFRLTGAIHVFEKSIQLQRLSRWHSRKQKGSANRKKSQRKLSHVHARIAHVRQDVLHKATAGLVAKNKSPDQRPAVIVIEDLNVSGMLKNRHLSRAIADVGLYEFRRQIEYKAKDTGCRILVVSRWEPSSQTCSGCGWRHPNLQLADRVFLCEECGLTIDRDLNAAQNLVALASCGRTVSYTGTDAWGQGSSGLKETRGETALDEPGTEPGDHSLSMKVQVSENGAGSMIG